MPALGASESLVLGLSGPGVGGLLHTPELLFPRSPVLRLSWFRGNEREERVDGGSRELDGDLETPDWLRRLETEGGDRRSGLLGDMFADFGRFLFIRPREADTSEE